MRKPGAETGEADPGLLGQKAGNRRRVTRVLFVTERNDADTRGLRHAAEISDRNTGHAVDRLNAVQLERIDDEVKSIRQFLLCVRRRGFRAFSFTAASAMGVLRLI